MRFVVFLLGLVLGVAGAIAYMMFFTTEPSATATQPVLGGAPITVSLGERFLTGVVQRAGKVADANAPQGVELSAAKLRVEPRAGVLALHASVQVLGKETTGTALLRPVLADGKLVIEVVETNLGSLPLQPVEKVLEAQINERIASLLKDMPVTFTGVSVDPVRGLTLTCEVALDAVAGPPPSA